MKRTTLAALLTVASANGATLIGNEFVNPNLNFTTDYSWVRVELSNVNENTVKAEFLFDLPDTLAVYNLNFDYAGVDIVSINPAYWGDSEQVHTQPSINWIQDETVDIDLNDGGAPYTQDTEATFIFVFDGATTDRDFVDAISNNGRKFLAELGPVNGSEATIDLYGHRQFLTANAPMGDPADISAVPEPSTALFGALAALGLIRRKR